MSSEFWLFYCWNLKISFSSFMSSNYLLKFSAFFSFEHSLYSMSDNCFIWRKFCLVFSFNWAFLSCGLTSLVSKCLTRYIIKGKIIWDLRYYLFFSKDLCFTAVGMKSKCIRRLHTKLTSEIEGIWNWVWDSEEPYLAVHTDLLDTDFSTANKTAEFTSIFSILLAWTPTCSLSNKTSKIYILILNYQFRVGIWSGTKHQVPFIRAYISLVIICPFCIFNGFK